MKDFKLLAYTVFSMLLSSSAYPQVDAYRQSITIATYGVREPEVMPDWRTNHYPYTMMDRLTNERGWRTYNALYVENEYVKALVLPELGGRLHGAWDKTNGYGFLYDQKVIKPGLVAITGAWISGGVEWNFPTGHRPSGFRDTDWAITANQDGTRTVWVGEVERLKRMRWSVGTTVHPGRNWVETRIRLENCTPFIQSFQYWATSAVRATPEYQAVIPGEIMTGHGKHEFFRWPVSDGVDISYWKNIPGASSFFAVESSSDYFGGYSPEEDAGMVHVADHHIVRGKKLWTWGTAPAGRLWEKILTDGDLPYFEPQAGAYSDNQPSLFWIMPGETKTFSHFWFPVRDIGVWDYANLEGAINLELKEGKAIFGWSPTGLNQGARIIISYDGEEIFHKDTDAGPADPFLGEVQGPGMTDLYRLEMIVLSGAGDTLLAFRHPRPENPPLPEPEAAPPAPDKVGSQDLLFLYGDRFYRYDDPEKGREYFMEALKRDPGDARCHASLGEMALKNGLFTDALEHFKKSIQRDETFFRAWYYMGLAHIYLGDTGEAERCLNRASYGREWYAIANFELARLMASRQQLDRAMEHINRSLKGDGGSTQAYAVKALILNRMGKYREALELTRGRLLVDPLDLFTKQLQVNAAAASGLEKDAMERLESELLQLTRSDGENHLEMAVRFAHCGNIREALDVIEMLPDDPDGDPLSPLVCYYKAFYYGELGEVGKARDLLETASRVSPKYCFPFRLETFPVLEWALSEKPDDAQAHYLLGNLLKKSQRPEEAVAHWEESVKVDPGNAVAQRNLGQAYHEQGDLYKAMSAYRAAIKADPSAGRAIVELGVINREAELPLEEQIALFEDNIDVVLEYNQAASQLILLYIMTDRNAEALKLLNTIHFNSWEGQYGIHQLWIQGNIKQGDVEFEKGNYSDALSYYEQSMLYPDNLEVAEQPNTIHARKRFKIGAALEALGRKGEAREYYEKVIAEKVEAGNAYQFYRARAMEMMGRKKEAKQVYEQMIVALDEGRNASSGAVSLFTRSLALEGLGKQEEAEADCSKAQQMNPLVEISAFSPPRSGF